MIVTAKYRIIVASIIIGISLVEVALGGFKLYEANEVLIATQFGLGSALLGLGLIKKK